MIKKISAKYNSIPIPMKASLWFTICYILQRGIQFIGIPIYTRMMSTEEYGIYSMFQSWFNIFIIFSSLNLYNGVFNKAMVKFEERRNEFISSVQGMTVLTTTFVSILIFIFHNWLSYITGLNKKILLLMVMQLMFYPSLQYWSQLQRFQFKYHALIFVTLINSIFSLCFGILSVFLSNGMAIGLIFSNVFIQVLICLFFFIRNFWLGKKFYNSNDWKWSFIVGLPLIPHYLSEIILGHADRVMINKICGAGPAGVYNLTYQISLLMTILRTGISGAFTPWFFYALKKQNYKGIKKATSLLAFMFAIVTLFIILLAPEIVKIAAPASYYTAIWDIPPIACSVFFFFIYTLFINIEMYCEHTELIAPSSIIVAVLNVILNYIFIYQYGYLAAGYTTLACYIILTILHYIVMKFSLTKMKIYEQIFNIKVLVFISLLLLILSSIALSLYNFTILRYISLAGLLITFTIKQRFFINLIKSFNIN